MTQPSADDQNAPRADGLRGVSVAAETARAKVNLTLEILGRRPDGYHELRSLVAFADYGDTLRLDDPAAPFSLQIDGPFASALEGGNLVQAAAELYARGIAETGGAERVDAPGRRGASGEAIPAAKPRQAGRAGAAAPFLSDATPNVECSTDEAQSEVAPLLGPGDWERPTRGAFRLTKLIPVAAGLGGGSADAAATLRLLTRQAPHQRPVQAFLSLAAKLGADVPACLLSKPAIMAGIGERLTILPNFPRVAAVLVNPRMPLATAAVFRELRATPLETGSQAEEQPPDFPTLDAVLDYARRRCNHLEPPARRLLPAIGTILTRLEQTPGVVLARLSGSGPTCFALFREKDEAATAAERLRSEHPEWWIEATTLG